MTAVAPHFYDTRHFVDSRLVTDIESLRAMIRAGRVEATKVNGRFRVSKAETDRLAGKVRGTRRRLRALHDAGLVVVDAAERIDNLRMFARVYDGRLRTLWTVNQPDVGEMFPGEQLWDDLLSLEVVEAIGTAEIEPGDVATAQVGGASIRGSAITISRVRWVRTSAVPLADRRLGTLLVDRSGSKLSLYMPTFTVRQDPHWIRVVPVTWAHLVAVPALGWPAPFDMPDDKRLPAGYGQTLALKDDPRSEDLRRIPSASGSPKISP